MRKTAGSFVALNLFLLFGGILGDPGVKPATYLHYTKNWYSGGKDLYKSDSSDESSESQDNGSLSDEESSSARDRRKKNVLSNRS